MLRRTRRPAPKPMAGTALRIQVFKTMGIASVGAALGFLFAKARLTEAELQGNLLGLYTTMGAAFAILSVRVFGMIRLMVHDYFGDEE